MKIVIPVKCQNGHKATWYAELVSNSLDFMHRGVPQDEKCDCPKHEIGQGYFEDGDAFVVGQSDAARDVLAERRRQVTVEGWTLEHDDAYQFGEMSKAAATYALADPAYQGWKQEKCEMEWPVLTCPTSWPWSTTWWKPRSRRENLVRAGALILAEIERIDRQAAKAVQS